MLLVFAWGFAAHKKNTKEQTVSLIDVECLC